MSFEMAIDPVDAASSSQGSSAQVRDRSAEREREDKLLSAKRKLKSYRARQSKASNSALVPSSPSSVASNASKRTSIIHGHTRESSYSAAAACHARKASSSRSVLHSPVSPAASTSATASPAPSAAAHAGKTAHGHAHRRSHSRQPSISKLSASLQQQQERDARRSSLIYSKGAAAFADQAPSSSNAFGPPLVPALGSSSSSAAPSTSSTTAPPAASDSFNKRASRRHSRTSSISISLAAANGPVSAAGMNAFDGYAAVSPSGASPRKFPANAYASSPSGSGLPASASSPSLSSSANAFANGPSPSSSLFGSSYRQSVPAFASSVAQHTLQNGRMVLSQSQQQAAGGVSPHSSPNPPQHAFSASTSFSNQNAFLNPNAMRRASLGVPKSPSFFESQQLQQSSSQQGTPSPSPSTSTSTTPSQSQHARRPSKHARRISVSTRRESMEIMAGIPAWNPAALAAISNSPNLEHSATGAFLSAADLSRSNTGTSTGSGADVSQDTVLGSSLAMEPSYSSSSEEEREFSLGRLEGRLAMRPDVIELPESSEATEAPQSVDSAFSSLSSAATKKERRSSGWNPRDSWGTTSPFAVSYAGNNKPGGGNLDMLVEEEEEEEEEAQENEASEEQSREDETATLQDLPHFNNLPFGAKAAAPAPAEQRLVSPPMANAALPRTGRVAPRPLSLVSSSSSMANLSSPSMAAMSPGNSSAEVKAARRQSGLRSLTLTSPEHVLGPQPSTSSPAPSSTGPLSGGFNGRKRQSLLLNGASSPSIGNSSAGGIRPFSISSTTSVLSPDASLRSNFQFGNGPQSASGTGVNRTRKSFSTASNVSVASSSAALAATPSRVAGSSAPPTGRPSLSYNNGSKAQGRRFSDLASPSSLGFGDLVMEQSVAEEDEDQDDDAQEAIGAVSDDKILDQLDRQEDEEQHSGMDLLSPDAYERSRAYSMISDVSVSEDPVIVSLQVRALKQRAEHLQAQLSATEAAKKEEVDALRQELSECKEQIMNVEEERDMLREDIDGWRTRCAGLERALQAERTRLDDERREGHLLRDKVRKLGDRLAQQQNGPSGDGTPAVDGGVDAALVSAQAKLIGEMRDQIFTLAAALERERLKSADANEGRTSRSSSPLLRALASQDPRLAASLEASTEEKTEKQARPMHHNMSTQSSAASGSYNFSSSFSSIHSQMGNATEDTSVADDNDSIYGAKSPVSPAFWTSSPSPSFSQTANSGISIHSSSLPLRNSDICMNYGGLQTLTEEDEEEMEDDADTAEIEEVNAQSKKALSMSSSEGSSALLGEEQDAVPELVHDDLFQRQKFSDPSRVRTQSASTGSSLGTNDHMPLTPNREHGSPNLSGPAPTQQQSKPSHHRSDSFIRQWSFPKGPVEPLKMSEYDDSFWHIHNGSLPALPLTASLVEAPPFSAEISLNEEYFTMATKKPLPASRPSSTVTAPMHPPPVSRSGTQAAKLRDDFDMPTSASSPSAGSRLSLQGLSSLWGNYMKSPQTPPASLPESAVSSFSSINSSKNGSYTSSVPKVVTPSGPGVRKPLLRLQASPVGRLDFTRCSACCSEDGSHGQRILRL